MNETMKVVTKTFQEYSDEELEIDPVTEREAKIFQEFQMEEP